jgi:hypothetical protein
MGPESWAEQWDREKVTALPLETELLPGWKEGEIFQLNREQLTVSNLRCVHPIEINGQLIT